MIRVLNLLISRIKGESFVLDSHISVFYIVRYFSSKLFSLFWGMLRLRRLKIVFVHPSSVIKSVSKIKCGKNFQVGRLCYVDALSRQGLICGDNVSMGYFTHIELTGSMKLLGQGMIVGNNVGFGSHGHYGSGAGLLEIGSDTIFGNYVSIHPENHNYSNNNTPVRLQGVNSLGG